MPVEHDKPSPVSLIVGCGFVGRVLARKLLARGDRVIGMTRTLASAGKLRKHGVEPVIASVTDREAMRAAIDVLPGDEPVDVYYLVPPGRPSPGGPTPQQVVIDGAKNTLAALAGKQIRRIVVASSTAVYGQRDGEFVDADTPAEPIDERGQLLRDGEQAWLDADTNAGTNADTNTHTNADGDIPARIVRLAGLYGPGRIIGLRAVRDGAPIVGDPDAWLNLIHVDDAAELLIATMTSRAAAPVELGSDGTPVRRIAYYSHLAQRIGAPPVRVLDEATAARELNVPPERLRRTTSKRCDNVVTCERTGWLPQYPSYREGLDALVEETAKGKV